MILYLTDDHEIASSIREREASRSESTEALLLPPGPIAAAALVAFEIGRLDPDLAVVTTRLDGDASARVGVIYRLETRGERWLPDALFGHDEEALSVRVAGEERPVDQHGIGEAAAAALGAAVETVGPSRVVALAAGAAAVDRLADLADRCAARALESYRTARLAREGGETVGTSVRLGGEVADRLRLTVTQRRRFLQTVRSAAARGGVVPGPLTSADDRPATNKAEGKRRLAEIERALEEWRRATG